MEQVPSQPPKDSRSLLMTALLTASNAANLHIKEPAASFFVDNALGHLANASISPAEAAHSAAQFVNLLKTYSRSTRIETEAEARAIIQSVRESACAYPWCDCSYPWCARKP
jgi:hypothetical protein